MYNETYGMTDYFEINEELIIEVTLEEEFNQ